MRSACAARVNDGCPCFGHVIRGLAGVSCQRTLFSQKFRCKAVTIVLSRRKMPVDEADDLCFLCMAEKPGNDLPVHPSQERKEFACGHPTIHCGKFLVHSAFHRRVLRPLFSYSSGLAKSHFHVCLCTGGGGCCLVPSGTWLGTFTGPDLVLLDPLNQGCLVAPVLPGPAHRKTAGFLCAAFLFGKSNWQGVSKRFPVRGVGVCQHQFGFSS